VTGKIREAWKYENGCHIEKSPNSHYSKDKDLLQLTLRGGSIMKAAKFSSPASIRVFKLAAPIPMFNRCCVGI